MQAQLALIKEFSIPGELSLSITYLQRALRDCVFQHQVLASKINNLPMHQRPKVKQYMLELEREMLSIGQEQEGLVRQLSERVKRFQMTIQSQHLVTICDDELYGYVSRQLNIQHETAVFSGTPKHISPRWSATELAQKYSLETILETACVKTEEIQLENHESQDFDAADDDDDCWKPVMSSNKRTKKQSKPASKTYTRPFATADASFRSVLKTKSSPPQATVAPQERAFASISGKKPTTLEKVKTESKLNVPKERESRETTEKSSEEEQQERKPVVKTEDSTKVETVTRGVWVPGCPGRPPKAANYISAAKLAAIRARRASVPLAQPIAQRRASKRMEMLAEKVKPTEPIDDSPGEDDDQLPEVLETSAAVRRGRSNLLQALKKQKRGPGRPPNSESMAAQQRASKRGPVPGVSKLVKHSSYASSGSSPNSRSSTPTWGTRQHSEDSCDRRSSSTEYPSLNDPGETPGFTATSIYDMGQVSFLRYHELHTPEEAQALKERKRERKRRSCYSTERKDFHYGKLDYYEQQQQYQAVRASKRTNQRPVLYSPPVAAVKKRKQSTLPSCNAATTSIVRHRPQPANIFAAMDKRSCFVCFKSGTTDELGACMNCCNIYHLSCHTIDEQSDAYRQRDDLCPVCLVSDDGNK
uniref:PHD-type domain-containing protein n=1 Tax=Anopheles funestus TaxID=62324 RepID=A0A4Y0BME2_ANOFN